MLGAFMKGILPIVGLKRFLASATYWQTETNV